MGNSLSLDVVSIIKGEFDDVEDSADVPATATTASKQRPTNPLSPTGNSATSVNSSNTRLANSHPTTTASGSSTSLGYYPNPLSVRPRRYDSLHPPPPISRRPPTISDLPPPKPPPPIVKAPEQSVISTEAASTTSSSKSNLGSASTSVAASCSTSSSASSPIFSVPSEKTITFKRNFAAEPEGSGSSSSSSGSNAYISKAPLPPKKRATSSFLTPVPSVIHTKQAAAAASVAPSVSVASKEEIPHFAIDSTSATPTAAAATTSKVSVIRSTGTTTAMTTSSTTSSTSSASEFLRHQEQSSSMKTSSSSSNPIEPDVRPVWPEPPYTIHRLACRKRSCRVMLPLRTNWQHERKVHQLKKFICGTGNCEASFDDEDEINQHITTAHADIKRWQCPDCSGSSTKYKWFQNHWQFCHWRGEFACQVDGATCRAVFDTKSNLNDHLFAVHQCSLICLPRSAGLCIGRCPVDDRCPAEYSIAAAEYQAKLAKENERRQANSTLGRLLGGVEDLPVVIATDKPIEPHFKKRKFTIDFDD